MELQKIAHDAIISNTQVDVAFLEYKTLLYGYQLKSVVVVGKTDNLIDKSYLKEFSAATLPFIRAAHGTIDPESTLIVSINILAGKNIDRSAIKFSQKSRVSKLGEREIPVVYDMNLNKYYTFNWYNPWGLFHAYYYRRTIKKIISFLETNDFSLFPIK